MAGQDSRNPVPTLPLTRLRVLDASNTYAGPTCARVLGDLGAEVIHVEAIQRWETVRLIVMPENTAPEEYWNGGAYFQKRNLGKKSITLNLHHPDGVAAFKRVAAHCDVMLESFAPRVMRGFGLDYEAIRALRPDVIYCSLSGYGQSGPRRDWIAYGMGLEPASGISQLTGYPDGPPLRSGISLTDPLTGLGATVAVLTALYHRRRTGKGQYIDLSEQEAALPLVAGALLDQQMNGRRPVRRGNRSPFAAPQGVYPAGVDARDEGGGMRDEASRTLIPSQARAEHQRLAPHPSSLIPHPSDAWIAISCHNDAEWERLALAIGRRDLLADERFADLLARHANHDALDAEIAAWTRTREKIEAMEHLQRAGVRAGAVLNSRDLLLNEHLKERGLFDRIEHPVSGVRPFPRQLPVHFSAIDPRPRGPAPKLGEHNDEILGGLAGLSVEELRRLREEQVIGEQPDPPVPAEYVRGVAEWPIDLLIEVGAIKEVDPDYRERLGL